MRTKKIYSKDATYQKFEVLKTNRNKRHRYGQFLVEGVRNINEAIGNGWQIHSFLYAKEKPLSRWARDTIGSIQTEINYELTPALMDELSGKDDTSELMAVVCMRKDDISQIRLSKAPLLMVFDRPSNHGNLGTIIRSCDAFGVDGLIITGHAVDLTPLKLLWLLWAPSSNFPRFAFPEMNISSLLSLTLSASIRDFR